MIEAPWEAFGEVCPLADAPWEALTMEECIARDPEGFRARWDRLAEMIRRVQQEE